MATLVLGYIIIGAILKVTKEPFKEIKFIDVLTWPKMIIENLHV
jgi:hypothetical protein